MFRKRAVPSISEIKARNVEHEHGSCLCGGRKGFEHRVPEIVFTMFGSHRDIFVCLQAKPRGGTKVAIQTGGDSQNLFVYGPEEIQQLQDLRRDALERMEK